MPPTNPKFFPKQKAPSETEILEAATLLGANALGAACAFNLDLEMRLKYAKAALEWAIGVQTPGAEAFKRVLLQ